MPCNVDQDIRIRAGAAEGRFRLKSSEASTVEVPMQLATPADSIELHIPCPASPQELGWSADPRRLGLGIKTITVVPS